MVSHKSKIIPKRILKTIIPAFILIAVAVLVGVTVMMTQNPYEKSRVVCIDAGHGGKDVGAQNGERLEKDDNLRIALAVKSELKSRGIKVVLTRNDDTFVSLDDRCKFANKKNSDLFVSLHRNSAESGSGVEIWVLDSKPETDTALAENILSGLSDAGISKNRGVRFGIAEKSGNYYVNKYTEMPSCLVEMGFITSSADNKLFDKNLNSYAVSIADGIVKTLDTMTADNNK